MAQIILSGATISSLLFNAVTSQCEIEGLLMGTSLSSTVNHLEDYSEQQSHHEQICLFF